MRGAGIGWRAACEGLWRIALNVPRPRVERWAPTLQTRVDPADVDRQGRLRIPRGERAQAHHQGELISRSRRRYFPGIDACGCVVVLDFEILTATGWIDASAQAAAALRRR